MSFYEPQGWQAPVRQTSWEQPAPPSRSGASSTSQRDDTSAFATQLEEVDRAVDNLMKSGKFFPGGGRRDAAPTTYGGAGRGFEHGSRVHGGRNSVSDTDPSRPTSASNLQNFYASQRYQGRPGEVDPLMQAKRRMAAQRERELRNYHQEQQYNRSVLAEMSSNKSDRSMSPSTLSEEGRRELIARQHRALYGGENQAYGQQTPFSEDSNNRDAAGNTPNAGPGGLRGSSPRGLDPFGGPGQGGQNESASHGSNTSGERKAGSPPTQAGGKTTTPPTGEESSHTRAISKSTTAPLSGAMGPIGSRPTAQQMPSQGLNKRTTSPLPSSLGYGFVASENNNERSNSSNSNSQQKENQNSSMGAWATGSGVWGSNKIGATSVWG